MPLAIWAIRKMEIKYPDEMITDSQTLGENFHTSADVVIVGSGAGGAPMAYQLARAGWKVILVEEGQNHSPYSYERQSWEPMRDMYRDSGMTFTLGTPAIPLPQGRTLGGTTVINSGTCFRIPEKVFGRWKNEFGLSEMEWSDLLPLFEKVEEVLHVQEMPFELLGANNQLFAAGAKKMGINSKPLQRNFKNCKGAGLCVFGCPENAK